MTATSQPATKTRSRSLFSVIVFSIALAILYGIQAPHAGDRITEVSASDYAERATELSVDQNWRYGFYVWAHGALLVKTRNVPGVHPYGTLPPDSKTGEIMLDEFRMAPYRPWLEGALYVALLGYILFIAPWARNVVSSRYHSRFLQTAGPLLFESLLWIAGWSLLIAPMVLWGYGATVYTTCQGRVFFSCSGPYLEMGHVSAETVTYRPLIERVAYAPLYLQARLPDLFRQLPKMSTGAYLWLAGGWFYGLLGLLFGAVRSLTGLNAQQPRAQSRPPVLLIAGSVWILFWGAAVAVSLPFQLDSFVPVDEPLSLYFMTNQLACLMAILSLLGGRGVLLLKKSGVVFYGFAVFVQAIQAGIFSQMGDTSPVIVYAYPGISCAVLALMVLYARKGILS